MKNSLYLLQESINGLNHCIDADNDAAKPHLSTAHYEASRLNTGLVQLLSLYRAELENLPINEDECFIDDLLEDLLLSHEHYLGHKNMSVETEQSPDLVRYFDKELISLLLNDILVNAMRYGKNAIKMNAFEQDNWLMIQIEDDGEGYPDSMLEANTAQMQNVNISEGRTGLGLFFARMIAAAHRRGDRQGEIMLSNGGSLGGSVFTLKLP
jgi:K+-sensing histidine kinase KdpD